MRALIVVSNPKHWPLHIPGVEVVPARSYLTDPKYYAMRGVRVFNLCRSYRYQSVGYYVSLLAAARGHKPLPSIATIEDMKSLSIVRLVSEDLEELIQGAFTHHQGDRFTLSVYFGHNLAKRYDRLSWRLFSLFQAPFLRAEFTRENGQWQVRSISPIPAKEIPQTHHPFVIERATEYFAEQPSRLSKRWVPRYDMAILVNPDDETRPSNDRAINKFIRAARRLDIDAEVIQKDDYGALPQFDALFLRETTAVNHHTYRFARRAWAEGLVVVDDPDSIARCSNKVYLAELLERHDIPKPRTLIVHRDNRESVLHAIGLPCVLKKPDSSASQGVFKAEDEAALRDHIDHLLEESDLIIAQEFLPTSFDWRVGVFDRKPLYVCQYYMAPRHWKIQHKDGSGRTHYGKAHTLAVENAPRSVVAAALRAANLIGDGLYGVDIKQVGRKLYVIEVNDNPSIDAGVEDDVLKDDLYDAIMRIFLNRLEQGKEARSR